jgi:hypothetical protein
VSNNALRSGWFCNLLSKDWFEALASSGQGRLWSSQLGEAYVIKKGKAKKEKHQKRFLLYLSNRTFHMMPSKQNRQQKNEKKNHT